MDQKKKSSFSALEEKPWVFGISDSLFVGSWVCKAERETMRSWSRSETLVTSIRPGGCPCPPHACPVNAQNKNNLWTMC